MTELINQHNELTDYLKSKGFTVRFHVDMSENHLFEKHYVVYKESETKNTELVFKANAKTNEVEYEFVDNNQYPDLVEEVNTLIKNFKSS
ncbi:MULTISPECIES: hypothetical protein [Bacillus]|uniref:hypothetical protein n=1 Tax=Bacillus TaxID=1386 RepID=UPI000D0275C5|nr:MULTISPECIES: hypothetical protein [Bacillus]MBU8573632.1 hypothetical protein [Bacillus pumilus]PRS48131.1 hypothetical protein C6Y06_17900 [Bacillus sp. MZGC1]PRS62875.1 hypothetical protein C6X98_16005 [Bacillus pumilus]